MELSMQLPGTSFKAVTPPFLCWRVFLTWSQG